MHQIPLTYNSIFIELFFQKFTVKEMLLMDKTSMMQTFARTIALHQQNNAYTTV